MEGNCSRGFTREMALELCTAGHTGPCHMCQVEKNIGGRRNTFVKA